MRCAWRFLCLCSLILLAPLTAGAAEPVVRTLPIGADSPDFKLSGVDGRDRVELHAYRSGWMGRAHARGQQQRAAFTCELARSVSCRRASISSMRRRRSEEGTL